MNKLTIALGAFAVTFGVTPAFAAEPGETYEPRSYVIDVKGHVLPTSLGELEYPSRAIEKSRAGECEVSLRLADTGAAETHHVVGCSHPSFRKAAANFAETLNFDPELAGTDQSLIVSWTVDDE